MTSPVRSCEFTTLTTLFSGLLNVQYGQFYLEAGTRFDGDMARCFKGQRNGLMGARVPGFLFATTGLHTGIVGVTVLLEEAEPPVDDSWDEIVEISLQASGREVALLEWASDEPVPLAVMAGPYRVRYSARAMDEAAEADTNEGPDPIDTYQIALWPAAPARDRVIKQTSETAQYWHDWVRGLGS